MSARIDAKNILIIKPSSIGDVVHTLPIWSLLRRHYPDAAISWLIAPACSGVVEGLPGLKLLRFQRREWAKAWYSLASARDLISFHRMLHRQRFDLVLDVQGLLRSAWFAWQTGAPVRVGFANAREMAWVFYTHRVDVGDPEQHALSRYLMLLEAIGCPTSPVEFPFPVSAADREWADDLAKRTGEFAILCPGTNWPSKRWPVERFAALAEQFQKRLGLRSICAGGPADRDLASQIRDATDLCGQTSLMQLAALMQRAKLVVANDSGPMHMACALGVPLVALFGPTNPTRTGPYGRPETVIQLDLECMPCYSRTCPLGHHRCMRDLTVERVIAAAQQQMSAGPGPQAIPRDPRG